MTDRIEKMLSIALQDANKALGEARRNVRVIEADANEIERLLSTHLQAKQAEASTTQAWEAVASAGNGSASFHCERCKEILIRRDKAWESPNGFTTCAETNLRHFAVTANGDRVDQNGTTRNEPVLPPATPAQPSPPPASEPTPAGQALPESDPTQVVDLRAAKGGA
jgi:hypothetical protein